MSSEREMNNHTRSVKVYRLARIIDSALLLATLIELVLCVRALFLSYWGGALGHGLICLVVFYAWRGWVVPPRPLTLAEVIALAKQKRGMR